METDGIWGPISKMSLTIYARNSEEKRAGYYRLFKLTKKIPMPPRLRYRILRAYAQWKELM